jgi:hypothetical protein
MAGCWLAGAQVELEARLLPLDFVREACRVNSPAFSHTSKNVLEEGRIKGHLPP